MRHSISSTNLRIIPYHQDKSWKLQPLNISGQIYINVSVSTRFSCRQVVEKMASQEAAQMYATLGLLLTLYLPDLSAAFFPSKFCRLKKAQQFSQTFGQWHYADQSHSSAVFQGTCSWQCNPRIIPYSLGQMFKMSSVKAIWMFFCSVQHVCDVRQL